MAFDSARSMKKILRFLFGLLIDVCILFVLVKAFSYSYDFAYQVFATTSVDVADNTKVSVEIAADETLLEVADSLYDAGVIENKYAFILKVRIGGDAGNIKAGTYQISPSDTNTEIVELITGATSQTSTTGTGSSGSSSSTTNNTGSEGDAEGADSVVVTEESETTEDTESTGSDDTTESGAGAE